MKKVYIFYTVLVTFNIYFLIEIPAHSPKCVFVHHNNFIEEYHRNIKFSNAYILYR